MEKWRDPKYCSERYKKQFDLFADSPSWFLLAKNNGTPQISMHDEKPCRLKVKCKLSPVLLQRFWKNFWLYMRATPLISATSTSVLLWLFIKLVVMPIANLPRVSFLLKPVRKHKREPSINCERGVNHTGNGQGNQKEQHKQYRANHAWYISKFIKNIINPGFFVTVFSVVKGHPADSTKFLVTLHLQNNLS